MTQPRVDKRPPETFTLGELAALFGVDEGTARGWTKNGCPYVTKAVRSRGVPWEFDLRAVLAWRVDLEIAAAGPDTQTVTLAQATRREAAARAELREMELATRRGELVLVADVETRVGEEYDTVRRRIRLIPLDVAPLVQAAPDVQAVLEVLEDAVEDALRELSTYGEASDPPGDSGGGPPAKPPDRARKPRTRSKKATKRKPPTGAAADPKRVGRSRARPKSGGERRAGALAD